MKHLQKLAFLLLVIVGLSGCHIINSSVMLRTPKDFKYSQFKDSTRLPDYKISANDILQFQIYSNDGFKIVDLTTNSGVGTVINTANSIEYRVDKDGIVKFPLLGKTIIAGYSLRQAEKFLEEKYTEFYNKPFVILKVTNKRVIIFPGQGGSARVLPLTNENTTLIEALALAGGISTNGMAHKVKLIRGDLQKPEVYLIDLSTIEGVKKADLMLQANDIIYVQPRPNISTELLTQITPIITILTNLILVYSIVTTKR